MWRAANNLLATAGNLWKRTVVQLPWCQRCKLTKETVFHTLYDCKASKKIWRLTPFGEDIEFSKVRDVLSLLQGLNGKRRKSEMELIVAVCWSIWHSRNLFLFKNKKEDPQLSVAAAEAMVQSYSRIQMPQMQGNSQQSTANQKQWKHPPEGWFKVNVDAAVRVEQQRIGMGIVIRNSRGKVIAAAIKPSKFIGKVDFAEAEAIRFGLEIAENVRCFPLIVESDSQEVVDLVNSKTSSRAEIFWVASEVQDRMKRLNQVKVQHTPRGNSTNFQISPLCTITQPYLISLFLEAWTGNSFQEIVSFTFLFVPQI
ncbi:RNase H domain-containing protein [Citrus sinensis]|nr:RNase H domain-containing protein [Citrus sinensis]